MTQFSDLFAALAAPFASQEVKARSQAGRQLHYVTARTVMNRLDAVVGPENWWDRYVASDNSVLCELTIRLPDGQALTKSDAGGYAGMADQGDDDKSGYSDAFKRAAVKFGVARYLYRDGVPEFVRERVLGTQANTVAKAAEAPPPDLKVELDTPAGPERPRNGHAGGDTPRSGRSLFAWVKDQEQRHEVSLLKYLNNWGKLHEFPGRMIDWDADQVLAAHAEAMRKLRAMLPDREELAAEAMSS